MRLSEVLNRAPDSAEMQVEGFLGTKKLGWGKHKNIAVGKVIRNYTCRTCGDIRTYISGEVLSCLITGDYSLSIDTTLRCSACGSTTEAWFLIGSDDFYAQSPLVRLERFTENRRDVVAASTLGTDDINDLFERAQIAFDDQLGAGAMIYLRKIFEITTTNAAKAVEIPLRNAKNRRKPFKNLLAEVDGLCQIIPKEFSSNGYKLFSEMSDVIHGEASEGEALSKYKPCRRLVLGVVKSIQDNQEMVKEIESLGWDLGNAVIAQEGSDK